MEDEVIFGSNDSAIINGAISSVVNVFNSMFGIDIAYKGWEKCHDAEVHGDFAGFIAMETKVKGLPNIFVCMIMNKNILKDLLYKVYGDAVEAGEDDLFYDGMGEITNMVGHGIKAILNGSQMQYEANLPQVVQGNNNIINRVSYSTNSKSIRIKFMSGDNMVNLEICSPLSGSVSDIVVESSHITGGSDAEPAFKTTDEFKAKKEELVFRKLNDYVKNTNAPDPDEW